MARLFCEDPLALYQMSSDKRVGMTSDPVPQNSERSVCSSQMNNLSRERFREMRLGAEAEWKESKDEHATLVPAAKL